MQTNVLCSACFISIKTTLNGTITKVAWGLCSVLRVPVKGFKGVPCCPTYHLSLIGAGGSVSKFDFPAATALIKLTRADEGGDGVDGGTGSWHDEIHVCVTSTKGGKKFGGDADFFFFFLIFTMESWRSHRSWLERERRVSKLCARGRVEEMGHSLPLPLINYS